MNERIKASYTERIERYHILLHKIHRKSWIFSISRLIIFIGVIIFLYLSISTKNEIYLTGIFAFLAVLFLFVWLHSRLISEKNHVECLVRINTDEIHALEGQYDMFDNGQEFIDNEHPYTTDLDIFGNGSFFQYINRTSTGFGKNELALFLSLPSFDKTSILKKQAGIKELQEKPDWRQNFQARGMGFNESLQAKDDILKWVGGKDIFDRPVFNIIRFIIPAITLLFIITAAFNMITWSLPVLFVVTQFTVTGFLLSRINQIHNQLSKKYQLLLKYSRLIRLIEAENFSSDFLKRLQHETRQNQQPASISLKHLASIVSAFDTRLNIFAGALLNGLLLWDIQQCVRLARWKTIHRQGLPKWFDVIGIMDAMNSLANYAYNHPDFIFPEISDNNYMLEALQAGHPLINPAIRIDNDIHINRWKQFKIITGANMAGKSTWLRTIGINMVIGMTGAPVCARQMCFYPVNVVTSLRTNDSLMNNESYFYAELKRLQKIIQHLERGDHLFVLLDEILKGTNSKDKHKGTLALLKQLIRFNAAGLIATHDVTIGELEKEFPDNLENLCFEVDIRNEQLYFDYTLRKGISRNLNATFLMKKMGITVD